MSRHPAQRTLTLTEELEKLEQSITLTLQEIDSNFSKAHRIVTTSILPIVEQYAKHSNDVWEGSKFWKHFFEASANVSLSGYEEAADEEITQTETSETITTPEVHDRNSTSQTGPRPGSNEEFSVDSPTQVTGLQTTPKLPPSTAKRQNPAPRGPAHTNTHSLPFRSPSPRKYTGKNLLGSKGASEHPPPSTPRQRSSAADLSSSPFEPESAFQPSARQQSPNNDPVMHRVLDKNYRIQATPHTQRRQERGRAAQPTPATATKKPAALWDDSPDSSPAIAAPQLRSDLFSPPPRAARTPGVSVLSPAARKTTAGAAGGGPTTSTGRKLFSPDDKAFSTANRRSYGFRDGYGDDDADYDDSSLLEGISPPKTLQFHVPATRLVQTPAREASRRIVEDLLLTAGADATDEIEGAEEEDAYGFGDEDDGDEDDDDEASPSVVRRAQVENDTF